MSNDPHDGSGPRGTRPLGLGPFPSPAAPRSQRQGVRRFGFWPAPSMARVALARALRWLAGLFAVVGVAIPIVLFARRVELRVVRADVARAAPAVELYQEPALPELRGSTLSASCPSCQPVAPELHQSAGLASSAPALRASAEPRAAPRPSTPRAAPAGHAKPKGDVVDPWGAR
jgi:hypothetical protein